MTVATATITSYGVRVDDAAFVDAGSLYRAVYAEAPYNETDADFQDFSDALPRRAEQPDFRLVIAYDDGHAVGFALGHGLRPGTPWWNGALSPLPSDVTDERDGRTFAVIELAVLPQYRSQGYGRALHAHLIAALSYERTTLLVRPDAIPAHRAYERWGYLTVGQIQPFPDAPAYDAMIRPLPPEMISSGR